MPYPMRQSLDETRYAPPGEVTSDLAPQLHQPGGATFCDHEEVEQGEEYYGPEEHQYTTYWFCIKCGEEIEHDEV